LAEQTIPVEGVSMNSLTNLSNIDRIKAKIKEVASEYNLEHFSNMIDELNEICVSRVLLAITGENAVEEVLINGSEYFVEICWDCHEVSIWCVPASDYNAVW